MIQKLKQIIADAKHRADQVAAPVDASDFNFESRCMQVQNRIETEQAIEELINQTL